MPKTISLDEWHAELTRLDEQAVEGAYTTAELVAITGAHQDKVRKLLKMAAAAGRLETVSICRETLGGLRRSFTAYRILPRPSNGRAGGR